MRLPFFRKVTPPDAAPAPARRRGASAAAAAAAAAADEGPVQAARTQARRRLIGALVLLAAGVIGFPVLFETQPRPLPVDTPILLPQGPSARPASSTAGSNKQVLPALPPDAGAEGVPDAMAVAMPPAVLPVAASAPLSASASTPAPTTAPTPTPTLAAAPAVPAPPAVKPAAAASSSSPADVPGRFVVQVGAYNDAERLKAARQRLDKLGFKSFTQEVETPAGKRTRVRVGPFTSRQEAEAAASRVKAAGLQANILSL